MTAIKVRELVPGDHISLPGMTAVYVGQGPHPVYAGLQAVVWMFPDGHVVDPNLKFSVDALLPEQEVGEIIEVNRTAIQRLNDLQEALNT